MCGIAGVLRIHQPEDGPPRHHLESIPERWLDILDDSIKHRGPDGQGRFRDRAVRDDGVTVDIAFVHRRLSIIDHAGGHQPMVHDGDRLRVDLTYQPGEEPKLAHELAPNARDLVAVVFNGCIYNHHQLRAELESKGAKFGSDHSDTEVLVHGWRRSGVDLGRSLDAMYACTIWDRATASLTLGRDLAHEKPLWIGRDGSTRLFASVPSAVVRMISALRGTAAVSSVDYIADWIRFGASEDPPHSARRWPYRNMLHRLEEYETHSSETRLDELPGGRTNSVTVEDLDTLLERAVASRLESDVALGCFLSGGIDSSLVAHYAKATRGTLRTFSVRMPDARYDESEWAERAARHIGTEHATLDCEASPASDLVSLVHMLGLPFGDSSLLPTYWVSKATRRHAPVAISGDGGDEVFAGYQRHKAALAARNHTWLLRKLPGALLPDRDRKSRLSKLRRLTSAARRGYPELTAIFLFPDLQRLLPEADFAWYDLAPLSEGDPAAHDFYTYLANDLLCKVDTASMACALEVRAPLLSREVARVGLECPYETLMPNGQRKGLLKQVARRYLPDEIINRPKQGFAIPIGDWFRTDYGNMRQLLYDHLESADPFPGLAEAGVNVNMTFVNRMLREHDAAGERSINPWHGRDHAQRLYMLLVLSIWAKWLASLETGQ